MIKYISIFIVFGIIFIYDLAKYSLTHFITSPFQNEYEHSFYYKFKVPKEWVLIRRDEDYMSFIGPTSTKKKELTSIKVFTNFENFENYAQYFDKKNCKDIDSLENVKNTLLFEDKRLNSDGEMIFCNRGVDKHSYLTYSNKLALTTMLILPYSEKYKEKYIKLFKEIDYILLKSEVPQWVLE